MDLAIDIAWGVCNFLKWSCAIWSMCFKSVVARAFAERRRPSTETEALLPRSSASLLEDKLNHSEVCNLSMSLNFLSWEARLAAIRVSRKLAMSRAGARGVGVSGKGGCRTGRTACKPESASGYNTTFLVHLVERRISSYAGIADPNRTSATRPSTGSQDGRVPQSKVISASSSLVMPSPWRADFQLSIMDLFLDLDTDRPALKT